MFAPLCLCVCVCIHELSRNTACAQASDGAKRCLLDYTLERTSSAEAELEGLLVIVAEISDGGSAAAKSSAMECENDALRQESSSEANIVTELSKTTCTKALVIGEQCKIIRAELRKAESKAAAEAASARAAASQNVVGGGGSIGGEAHGADGGRYDSYSATSSGGGGGGGNVTPEMLAMITSLSEKVRLIETHHGDQLRALVAKVKDLNKIVKFQQELLSKTQPGTLPPPPPNSFDDLHETASQLLTEALVEIAAEAPEGADMSVGAEVVEEAAESTESREAVVVEAAEQGLTRDAASEDATSRMLERESVLLDRIKKQENQLACLEVTQHLLLRRVFFKILSDNVCLSFC